MTKRAINEFEMDGQTFYMYRYVGDKHPAHKGREVFASPHNNPSIVAENWGDNEWAFIPEPVTPDGKLAVDAFVGWAIGYFVTGHPPNGAVESKLRELNLLSEEKPDAQFPFSFTFNKPVKITKDPLRIATYHVEVLDE